MIAGLSEAIHFPLIFSEAKQNKTSYAWFQVYRWSDIVYMGYFPRLIHLGWFYDAVTRVPISTLDICQEEAEIKPLAHFLGTKVTAKLYLTWCERPKTLFSPGVVLYAGALQ